MLWEQDGIPVSTAARAQFNLHMVGAGSNAAVAVWQDERHGNGDVFGTRVAPRNVVLNPGCESRGARWKMDTDGRGTFTTVTPGAVGAMAGKIDIVAAGSHIELYQSGIPLQRNTPYRLKFRAYSSSGHDLVVAVHKHTSPGISYGLQSHRVNLTTSWETISIDFITAGFTQDVRDGRLRFLLASYTVGGDQYFFDAVSLERWDAAGAVTAMAPAPAPCGTAWTDCVAGERQGP